MDADDLISLDPKQKRERLAAWHFPQYPTYWEGGELRHRYPGDRSGPAFDYLNDRDVISLLESELPEDVRDLYVVHLREVCRRKGGASCVQPAPGTREDFWMLRLAEPEQCADAMILTVVEPVRTQGADLALVEEARRRRAGLAKVYREYASQCRRCEMEADAREWDRKAAALERASSPPVFGDSEPLAFKCEVCGHVRPGSQTGSRSDGKRLICLSCQIAEEESAEGVDPAARSPVQG